MASFRDPHNPDAIHFPGELSTKIVIVLNLLFCLAALIATLTAADTVSGQLLDLILVLALLALAFVAWPGEIIVDQAGLHYFGFLRIRRTSIHWKAVRRAYIRHEFGRPLASLLRLHSDAVAVEGEQGTARIVHTPRHSDRKRFLSLLNLNGVAVDQEFCPPPK